MGVTGTVRKGFQDRSLWEARGFFVLNDGLARGVVYEADVEV